ncbi:hypothetical protein N657DRAFT_621945 [Parathielavia appendiculata]|uniref:Meiotically up-regulated 65 protein n=1 Tax=Parathielavia appendiculata TaxID=2587402 RepID=A0AAN6TXG5_9PEZI|nr:hypothetical protein N657DRAFT_621945 [Parathielavia appendiculata]
MPKIRHHRSSRRVPPPQDSDFDHEISLVDRDEDQAFLGPSSTGPSCSQPNILSPSATESQAADEEQGPRTQDRAEEEAGQPSVVVEEPTPRVEAGPPKPVMQTMQASSRPNSAASAIDILYENQRGGFLCGMALFSSKALGNLDPPAWTNYAHKPSPTDISNAQVPDPSWEWAWSEWRINRDEGVDEDGWEYSFAFSKRFSWHKARWWNSFVRRRAWIRKRVKKNQGYIGQDPHMLNPEYFTIRPSAEIARNHNSSRASSTRDSRLSMSTVNMDEVERPIIEHADELLRVLRVSRIDREKIEAVENYLANAKEDFHGLQEIMHEIMSLFVFQASRRVLLSRLTEVYHNALVQQEKENEANSEADRRVKNLEEAVKHADEEVRRLEYWSDVKGIANEGDSKGAVDQGQGWDETWRGVDMSGPSAPVPKHEASAST